MTDLEMRKADAARLLREAARLVTRALNRVDAQSVPCRCCGTLQFRDRTQGRVFEQLAETPERLKRAAEKLLGPSEGPSQGFDDAVEALHAAAGAESLQGGDN